MNSDALSVPLVPAGRRTFNLTFMILHDDVTEEGGDPAGEVTMFPGRVLRLAGRDAEHFARVLSQAVPHEWRQFGSLVRSRTEVVAGEPVEGGVGDDEPGRVR